MKEIKNRKVSNENRQAFFKTAFRFLGDFRAVLLLAVIIGLMKKPLLLVSCYTLLVYEGYE